jgi:hypothetical protein
MPYKKRYTKAQKAAYAKRMRRKKRLPAKAKAYKNSYAIAKITAPLMPKTRLCMMNYVQRFRLDPNPVNAGNTDVTNSLLPIRTFTINNLKDFDEQTSGIGSAAAMNDEFANHQPRGYDQWGTHYNNMTVLSTKSSIEARNRYVTLSDANHGPFTKPPEPVAVGFLTSHFNKIDHSTALSTKFNDVLEQRQVIYRELNDDRHKVKLTHSWSLKKEPTHMKNLNMETTTSDYAWGSMYNQDINQANKRFLHIFATPLGIKDNVDPTPIDFTVQISAVVLLSNRNDMSRS